VPFGIVGGMAALVFRGLPFSIPAAVGFIALCGVAVLNGVVLASELRRRLDDASGIDPWTQSAVAVLRPVVTTALVAAIGFLPMALSTRAGAEVQRPLATVVIGGILSSTAISMFVLPALLKLAWSRKEQTDRLLDETPPPSSV
jgi:cobalt-zinc-cadmium resistance protein CzcA